MSSTPSSMPISHSWWVAVGAAGANPTPQLPIASEVTPCWLDGASTGSQVAWPSKWVWMSTKPGVTSRPSASMTSAPVASTPRPDLGRPRRHEWRRRRCDRVARSRRRRSRCGSRVHEPCPMVPPSTRRRRHRARRGRQDRLTAAPTSSMTDGIDRRSSRRRAAGGDEPGAVRALGQPGADEDAGLGAALEPQVDDSRGVRDDAGVGRHDLAERLQTGLGAQRQQTGHGPAEVVGRGEPLDLEHRPRVAPDVGLAGMSGPPPPRWRAASRRSASSASA